MEWPEVGAWRALVRVRAPEPGLSAREVAVRTAMDKVAVSRAVNRLIANGHITRAFAEVDRRRSELRLSGPGKAVYRQIVPLATSFESALLSHMSAEDRILPDQILDKLQLAEKKARPTG